jgi:hypothetical protein
VPVREYKSPIFIGFAGTGAGAGEGAGDGAGVGVGAGAAQPLRIIAATIVTMNGVTTIFFTIFSSRPRYLLLYLNILAYFFSYTLVYL